MNTERHQSPDHDELAALLTAQTIHDAMMSSIEGVYPMGDAQTGALSATATWAQWIRNTYPGVKVREE